MRVAVLRNPASSQNAGSTAPDTPDGVTRVDLTGLADLRSTLRDLRDAGTDLLVVDGGDGTVREVVSLLPDVFGDAMPVLGILANGNTNLVARKCGRISGYATLAALSDQPPAELERHCRRVPLLRFDGLVDRPVRGFIAGWGAYAAGTRIAVEELSARSGKQVVGAVLAVLRRAVFGRDARSLRAGVCVRMHASGYEEFAGQGFAGIITVLEGRLVAGLSPFWGDGAGAIRWTHISAPPRWLMLAAPFVAMGRPVGWMHQCGYSSGRSDEIALDIADGLVIDGEVFPTRSGQPVRLSAHEVLQVVAL